MRFSSKIWGFHSSEDSNWGLQGCEVHAASIFTLNIGILQQHMVSQSRRPQLESFQGRGRSIKHGIKISSNNYIFAT